MNREVTCRQVIETQWNQWMEWHPYIANFIERLRGGGQGQGNAPRIFIKGGSKSERIAVAHFIHRKLNSVYDSFVEISCRELPVTYTEALFFGFEPGFMGWGKSRRDGYFSIASGGTLFMDEIDHLDLDFQNRFSTCLQSEGYRILGSEKNIPFQCNFIATSSYDLALQSELGKFQDDLYFRLSELAIELPPVAERKQNLKAIIELFLRELNGGEASGKSARVSDEAMKLLLDYSFPGEVDELFQVLHIALRECHGKEILPDHLAPFSPILRHFSPLSAKTSQSAGMQDLPGIEEIEILNFVNQHGHITNTQCRDLIGVNRFRASYLLKKLDSLSILNCVGRGRNSYYTRNSHEMSA